jgi:hypothetical protein
MCSRASGCGRACGFELMTRLRLNRGPHQLLCLTTALTTGSKLVPTARLPEGCEPVDILFIDSLAAALRTLGTPQASDILKRLRIGFVASYRDYVGPSATSQPKAVS